MQSESLESLLTKLKDASIHGISSDIGRIFAILQNEEDSEDFLKESSIRENSKVKKLSDLNGLTILTNLFFKYFPQELNSLLVRTEDNSSSTTKEFLGKEEKETNEDTISFLRLLKLIQYVLLYQSVASPSKIKLEDEVLRKLIQYSNFLLLFLLNSTSTQKFSNLNINSSSNKGIICRIAVHIQGYIMRASIESSFKETVFKNFIYLLHETSEILQADSIQFDLVNGLKQSIMKELIHSLSVEEAASLSLNISIYFKYIENILYVCSDSSIRELVSVFLARFISVLSIVDKGNKNNNGEEVIIQLKHRISHAIKLWLTGKISFGSSFTVITEGESTILNMSRVHTIEEMKKLTHCYVSAISTIFCILMANLELGIELYINETLANVLDMFDDFNVRAPIEQSTNKEEKEIGEKWKQEKRKEVKTIVSLSFALCAAHQKFQAIIRGDNKNAPTASISPDAPEVLDDLLDLLDISFSGESSVLFNEKEINLSSVKSQAIYVSIISKLVSAGKPPNSSPPNPSTDSTSRQRSYDMSRHTAQIPSFLQFIFSIIESNSFKESPKSKTSNSNTKEIDSKDRLAILEMNVESMSFLSLIPSVRELIFSLKVASNGSGKKEEGKLMITSLLDFAKSADSSLRYGILNVIHNISKYVPKKGQIEEMQEQLQKFASGEALNDPSIKEKLKKGANLEKEETEEFVNKRVLSLVSTGATSLLVTYFKLLSSSGTSLPADRSKYLSDLRMKAMIAEILVDLATVPKTRGKLVQDGAAKCLLNIYFQSFSKSNSNKLADDKKLENRIANLCSHALAKIAISVDPNIAFRDSVGSLIDPLVYLLSTSSTPNARYEEIFEGIGISVDYISQVQHFESLLALTNIASMGEESINAILKSNNKQTLGIIESSQLSNNEMIQRAASELMCNLVMHEDVSSEYLEQNGKTERRFKIWGALSGSEDINTVIASTGALAILSSDPKICENMLVYLDNTNNGVVAILQDTFNNSDARVQHRTIEIIKNLLMHSNIPKATKTKLKTFEKYLIAVAKNTQYPIQPARETALVCLQILNKL